VARFIDALAQQLSPFISGFKRGAHLFAILFELIENLFTPYEVFSARKLDPAVVEIGLLPFDIVNSRFGQLLIVGEGLRVLIDVVNGAPGNDHCRKQQNRGDPKPDQQKTLEIGPGDGTGLRHMPIVSLRTCVAVSRKYGIHFHR
jgi:hypothetical protein